MLSFLSTNKHFAAQASPESLGALLHTEAVLLEALRGNTMVCAMLVEGRGESAEFEHIIVQSNRAEADAVNLALFDAIRSGQTSANTYARLGQPEWQRIGLAFVQAGVDTHTLQQFGVNPASLSPAAKCDVVRQLFTTMSEEPDLALRARYGAEMVRGM